MSYHGNFTHATFVESDLDAGAPALIVDGKSLEPENAEQIFVAMPHGGELLFAEVQDAAGATDWVATFAQPNPPLREGDEVMLFGVAVLTAPQPPFFWADRLQIASRDSPP